MAVFNPIRTRVFWGSDMLGGTESAPPPPFYILKTKISIMTKLGTDTLSSL